ncbi:MAG: neutral/alkaline non-lysosomal ceramidase N-terminal domain-containing protein, partial [Planctomycetaceae bacterium]|nr:neutral/alkaline non-lysosomal ceramidase N-terminal domain-containing protein [Planctomycetaceae bacterium]
LATGTTDPLKAKAVVFRGNNQTAAFVIADLTGISRDLYLEVRNKASKKTGIPVENIVLSATHSHTAPDYSRRLYAYLDKNSKTDKANSYSAQLIDSISKAIINAHTAAQPAILEAGSAKQTFPVSFNRRFVMKDGSVKTWQSLSNPDVLRAAGPIDPEIGLLLIKSSDGKTTRGLISNFALHLDTVGGKNKQTWSADFPYFIEQAMRKEFGDQLISVFGAGTCGDINHSDPTRKTRNTTEIIGTSLAQTISPALSKLVAVKDPKFQVRSETVHLPLQVIRKHELEKALHILKLQDAGENVAFFDRVESHKAVFIDQLRHKTSPDKKADYLNRRSSHAWGGIGESLPVEVTTMTIGNEVAIVFLPGEVFVDLGLAIKQASPFRTTLIIELSNCVETYYIPTRAACAGGSYEVTNSNVQPGSGEMLVESALKLLRQSAADE